MSLIVTWMRGLALLRHPEMVADLAVRLQQVKELRTLAARFPSAKIGRQVRLLGFEAGMLELGTGSTVCDATVLSFGDELNGRGRIEIGERTWIGQYNNLRAGGGDIRIGRNCLISQFCSLVASNHGTALGSLMHSQPPEPTKRGVTLGDDVWLGVGAAVMPGVSIGEGAVIGANSVVTRDVPGNEVWAGVPARRIGNRT